VNNQSQKDISAFQKRVHGRSQQQECFSVQHPVVEAFGVNSLVKQVFNLRRRLSPVRDSTDSDTESRKEGEAKSLNPFDQESDPKIFTFDINVKNPFRAKRPPTVDDCKHQRDEVASKEPYIDMNMLRGRKISVPSETTCSWNGEAATGSSIVEGEEEEESIQVSLCHISNSEDYRSPDDEQLKLEDVVIGKDCNEPVGIDPIGDLVEDGFQVLQAVAEPHQTDRDSLAGISETPVQVHPLHQQAQKSIDEFVELSKLPVCVPLVSGEKECLKCSELVEKLPSLSIADLMDSYSNEKANKLQNPSLRG